MSGLSILIIMGLVYLVCHYNDAAGIYVFYFKSLSIVLLIDNCCFFVRYQASGLTVSLILVFGGRINSV